MNLDLVRQVAQLNRCNLTDSFNLIKKELADNISTRIMAERLGFDEEMYGIGLRTDLLNMKYDLGL